MKKKLIIERTKHGFYVYTESLEHHKKIEQTGRGVCESCGHNNARLVPASVLENECHLATVLTEGDYIVMDVIV